jgi:archaeal flagellar protein FlaJ
MLKKLEKKAYQWFGAFTRRHVSESLRNNLRSAHMNIREDAFLSVVILYTIISGIITSACILILWLLIFPLFSFTPPFPFDFIMMLLPLILMTLTYMIFLQIPVSKAKARGKQIDVNLSYALNFVAAMSSAGVTPTEIFKSLSKQKIYGEVQKEAAWIYRDVAMMGKDIIQSIKDNMYRSPSERFREFLQGLIVTITSGGSLKTYFTAKADQYMVENRQKQKQLFESLGIMAESYVTAAVAGILLLFIVIPLMMIISGDSNQISFLYLITFAIVPMIHLGFTYVIRMMSLEA